MEIKRRKTRQINVGAVKIGGNAPVSIQSMAKTDTNDWQATVKQIKILEGAGCELVRVAVKEQGAAKVLKKIKSNISIPLIADIHFDYRLALTAIEQGVDKIRINPGNMKNERQIREVVAAAKQAKIPVRIGLNSGSAGDSSSDGMVKEAINCIKLFEKEGFYDTVISLKASDVATVVSAYRKLAGLCDYPFHLGVTASGPYDDGIVKSSVGIGGLLLDGIGDTIRVSLTADPVEEVKAARRILQSVGLRRFYPEIISCPTCGRCQVDLERIVKEFEKKIHNPQSTIHNKRCPTVAIMGCEVNGPGEAKEADIGIAAGKDSGMLFKKGRKIKRVAEKDFVKVLVEQLSLRA